MLIFSQPFRAKYRIEKLIGEGGMGAVYLAEEIALSRPVAIKLVKADAFQGSVERLLEEARVCARIKHPNVVKVLSEGIDEGRPYVVFEYVEGHDLGVELQKTGPLGVARTLTLGREILAGLSAAHEHGIVHRDIKPSNIFLRSPDGEPMLMDFGVARAQADRQVSTQAGMLLGTPAYMAPEVIAGDPPTPAADVYACGCLFYECLTGHPPFVAPTEIAVMSMHVGTPPPSLAEALPGAPDALVALIDRALAKQPKDRFSDARELGRALVEAFPGLASGRLDPAVIVAERAQVGAAPTPSRSGRAPTQVVTGSRPDPGAGRTTPITRPGAPSRARSRATGAQGVRRRRRLSLGIVVAVAPALAFAAFAWWRAGGASDVLFGVDDDGSIEATWTSRGSERGSLVVLPVSHPGSPLTTAEPDARTRHAVRFRGLAPGAYHAVLAEAGGRERWSGGFEVPARAAAARARAGGAWEVTAPGLGAAEGWLVVPRAGGGHERIRNSGARDGALWFEHAFGANGPPPGTLVAVQARPELAVRFRVDHARDLARTLRTSLAALPFKQVAIDVSKGKTFEAENMMMRRGWMTAPDRGRFVAVLDDKLNQTGVLPALRAFAPVADRYFESDDGDRAELYDRLVDLAGLEGLVLSQRESVRQPARLLHRKLVAIEHRTGDWDRLPPADPGEARIVPRPTLFVPDGFDSWELVSIWSTKEPHLAREANTGGLDALHLSAAARTEVTSNNPNFSNLRTARTVELKLVVAFLAPAYHLRVTFRGAGPPLRLHLGHGGDSEWYAAMDGSRPASLEVLDAESKRNLGETFYWGVVRARFPAWLLPRGPLEVRARLEVVPHVNIARLLFPMHRVTLVRELSIRPVN